jgi:hypothetical protein
MPACTACAKPIEAGLRSCPSCGAAVSAPAPVTELAPRPPRRRRPLFWAFVGVMGLAVAGGGSISLLVLTTSAERRNFARAEPQAAAQPQDGPAEARALLEEAEARRKAADVDGAIGLYLAALRADPSLAEAERELAACYQLKGDTRRAAERYRRYLATDPPDAARVRVVLEGLE